MGGVPGRATSGDPRSPHRGGSRGLQSWVWALHGWAHGPLGRGRAMYCLLKPELQGKTRQPGGGGLPCLACNSCSLGDRGANRGSEAAPSLARTPHRCADSAAASPLRRAGTVHGRGLPRSNVSARFGWRDSRPVMGAAQLHTSSVSSPAGLPSLDNEAYSGKSLEVRR